MASLVGIARAPSRRAALVELPFVEIGLRTGVAGDARGRRPGRQVTVLFREGWEAACRDLGVTLPWTTRRANLLVEGLAPPRARSEERRVGKECRARWARQHEQKK